MSLSLMNETQKALGRDPSTDNFRWIKSAYLALLLDGREDDEAEDGK